MQVDLELDAEFVRDVRNGLCGEGPKQIPPRYLYDNLGTALFDAIIEVPEYGLPQADERVLKRCAPLLPRLCAAPEVVVAELGSGSGSKTRRILEAFPRGAIRRYSPIDISAASLARCERELARLVRVEAFHGPYLDGVRAVSENRSGAPVLLLFLGSSIGNLDRDERAAFLRQVRSLLRPGDRFLLGVDLVKPRNLLLAAYDDPTGVTAAFNRNLLGRINRELGADFDLASFEHVARYDEQHQRIEMHLLSPTAQQVAISGAEAVCCLGAGETIWTESSYKFERVGIRDEMARAGFRHMDEWVDEEWPFLEGLWTVG